MRCNDCERIDDLVFDNTSIWLYLPTSETYDKLAKWCTTIKLDFYQFHDRGINITLQRDRLKNFIIALNGEINGLELANIKIVTTEGAPPTPEDIGRVLAGNVFVSRFQSGWIVEALEQERYESWYQPIVYASNRGEKAVFAHEALFRMRDANGDIIPASHVFDQAENSDLLFAIDLAARRSAVENAARGKGLGKLFINFNPSSIYDPSYCLRSTAAAIAAVGLSPADVVFELTETHRARDKAHLKGILAFYRQAGYGIALDDVGSGYSSLNMLHETRPDYAKIDMALIRNVHKDSFKQTILTNLICLTKENGIKTVAEGIETEEEANWLANAGADYLQGYYFGKPQPLL